MNIEYENIKHMQLRYEPESTEFVYTWTFDALDFGYGSPIVWCSSLLIVLNGPVPFCRWQNTEFSLVHCWARVVADDLAAVQEMQTEYDVA